MKYSSEVWPAREADRLSLQIADLADLDAPALFGDDGERRIAMIVGRVVHDEADDLERISGVHGLQIGGRAHVADLRLAVMQGIDHVSTGVHHPEAGVDAVSLEEALLGADEHRQMAEIVGDHHVEFGQVRHGYLPQVARYAFFSSTSGLTQFGGVRPSISAWMLSTTILAICSRTSIPHCQDAA